MPTHSKWQSLPTEAINPVSLAIDKAPGPRHHRHGHQRGPQGHRRRAEGEGAHRARRRDHRAGAAQGRPDHLHRRRHQRPPRRRRSLGDAADVRHAAARSCRRSWPAARRRCSRPRKASRTTTRKGARSIGRLRLTQARRRHRRVGQRHDAVRPRRPDPRAQGRREDHLRHLLARLRAAELRRPADRAGGRARAHRRLDAAQGRHRDQDGAQHADHGRDDQGRQDLRQPDGGRADRIREAQGSRPADPRHGHRHRLRRRRRAAQAREVERQGGDRHAEGGA